MAKQDAKPALAVVQECLVLPAAAEVAAVRGPAWAVELRRDPAVRLVARTAAMATARCRRMVFLCVRGFGRPRTFQPDTQEQARSRSRFVKVLSGHDGGHAAAGHATR